MGKLDMEFGAFFIQRVKFDDDVFRDFEMGVREQIIHLILIMRCNNL